MFAELKIASLIFAMLFVTFTQSAFAQVELSSTQGQDHTILKTTQDGTINVQINSNLPKENSPLAINLRFFDAKTGITIPSVNYDIIAMQNGELVLSHLGLYAASGTAQHTTAPLSTDNQVDVIVILQGIGENAPYTGPSGETIETLIVPEFGLIAPIALTVSISAMLIIQKTIPNKNL